MTDFMNNYPKLDNSETDILKDTDTKRNLMSPTEKTIMMQVWLIAKHYQTAQCMI